MRSAGVKSELIEQVQACRERAAVQKRVLEREVVKLMAEKASRGDGMLKSQKELGASVGCDGVG